MAVELINCGPSSLVLIFVVGCLSPWLDDLGVQADALTVHSVLHAASFMLPASCFTLIPIVNPLFECLSCLLCVIDLLLMLA